MRQLRVFRVALLFIHFYNKSVSHSSMNFSIYIAILIRLSAYTSHSLTRHNLRILYTIPRRANFNSQLSYHASFHQPSTRSIASFLFYPNPNTRHQLSSGSRLHYFQTSSLTPSAFLSLLPAVLY